MISFWDTMTERLFPRLLQHAGVGKGKRGGRGVWVDPQEGIGLVGRICDGTADVENRGGGKLNLTVCLMGIRKTGL